MALDDEIKVILEGLTKILGPSPEQVKNIKSLNIPSTLERRAEVPLSRPRVTLPVKIEKIPEYPTFDPKTGVIPPEVWSHDLMKLAARGSIDWGRTVSGKDVLSAYREVMQNPRSLPGFLLGQDFRIPEKIGLKDLYGRISTYRGKKVADEIVRLLERKR